MEAPGNLNCSCYAEDAGSLKAKPGMALPASAAWGPSYPSQPKCTCKPIPHEFKKVSAADDTPGDTAGLMKSVTMKEDQVGTSSSEPVETETDTEEDFERMPLYTSPGANGQMTRGMYPREPPHINVPRIALPDSTNDLTPLEQAAIDKTEQQ